MRHLALLLIFCFSFLSCDSSNQIIEEIPDDNQIDAPVIPPKSLKLLSLGDSYTIGESVCDNCRFPNQLKDSLYRRTGNQNISLQIIARTGWTTTNLINALDAENLVNGFDLVTLLIGVNNQYQRLDFSIYENEFPKLISKAVELTNNNKTKVIVISIPDYAFTPFGGGNTSISSEIDKYNNFAESYCVSQNITFINITDITRQGLAKPNLVANDGLHPSEEAYTEFVKRIIPFALEKL